jgi:IS30 family transposase
MTKLTHFERQIIESKLRTNQSHRDIAAALGRDRRVIDREIERNKPIGRAYTAATAQRLALAREAKRNAPKLTKGKYCILKEYITNRLKEDWSPEQIVGVLEKQPPRELYGQTICVETIYQFIYEGAGRYECLYPHLRRGRKKRQTQRARKPRKITIPERISIHERPIEVNCKTAVGHWESDTVEGKRTTTGNLSVQYERKLMLARLHKLLNKTAEETETAIRKTIDTLPLPFFKTITFDNGGEGATHINLRKDYDLQTFFCDAFASWQKGGVENLNGLVRQYIPKGTDISQLTDKQIYDIQERLNNRPRKSLHYLTPNQALACEVGH